MCVCVCGVGVGVGSYRVYKHCRKTSYEVSHAIQITMTLKCITKVDTILQHGQVLNNNSNYYTSNKRTVTHKNNLILQVKF